MMKQFKDVSALRFGGPVARFIRHTGLRERRHAGVARKRAAHDLDRERGARSFAEPHVEVEQRI
jgi:hypothetical protein